MSASSVATAATAPRFPALPLRNLAALSFAGIAALTLLGLSQDSLPAPAPVKQHISLLAPVVAKPLPKGPSIFELENAMSTRDLIARWNPIVAAASKRFGVPEEWVRAVMRMESGGRLELVEGQPVVSTAGAMGLMQVMPDTYALLRAQYGLGADPFNPHDNIIAGTAYLKWLNSKFGNPGMFAAYNAGPGRLIAYINDGTQLPLETRNYVGSISRALNPGQAPGEIGVAKLTMPNGVTVQIPARSVMSVRAALPGEYTPGVQAVVKIGNRMQGVREDVAAVNQAIRAAGLTL